MDRNESLLEVIDNIRHLAQSLQVLVEFLVSDEIAGQSQTEVPVSKARAQETPTIDQIRSVLAEKSGDGKTAEVKALLYKYDAGKLSGVKPEDYPALLEEAKKL